MLLDPRRSIFQLSLSVFLQRAESVFLFVQWTEYKFTCVCVSVSVTLFVNSPTGQTPQRIFTVDSLKDADLRKDVAFGGFDDESSHLGVQSPPKPLFWGPG